LAWWHSPVVPGLGRLRQENCKFKASLDYIAYLKKKTKTKPKTQQPMKG
jgi:hypothetical protein